MKPKQLYWFRVYFKGPKNSKASVLIKATTELVAVSKAISLRQKTTTAILLGAERTTWHPELIASDIRFLNAFNPDNEDISKY